MNRVLFLSDKATDQIKQQMSFMYGHVPTNALVVSHVLQCPQEIDEDTLVQIAQQPITLSENVPVEGFYEAMAKPPYNLRDVWLKQFDRILVTFYDQSKQDRFIQTVK